MDAEMIELCIGNDGTGARHVAGISQALRINGNASLAVGLDVPHSPAAQLAMRKALGNSDGQALRLTPSQPRIERKSPVRSPFEEPTTHPSLQFVTDVTIFWCPGVENSIIPLGGTLLCPPQCQGCSAGTHWH